MERQFLTKQTEEYRAKIASLDRQRAQKEAERDTIAATISKLEADEPIIKQRVDIRKYLADRELGSRLTYLEMLQLLTENEKDIAIQQSRLDEANAALAAVIQTRAQGVAEFHRTLFGDLAEAERKAAGLAGDLAKAEQRSKLQMLDGSGRWCRPAAFGSHRWRRRDTSPTIGRRRTFGCDTRNRGYGLEPRHRFCSRRPGGTDQG